MNNHRTMEHTSKKIDLDLTEVDGNAFGLLAAFQRQARREGWNAEEIKLVLDDARSGDYDHLVGTLDAHCR
jgi:hypothetical protein